MARLKDLECDEDRLVQEITNLPERTVVRLPANYEALHRVAIAELEQHLATREGSASRNAIRTLIEAVVVHGRKPAAASIFGAYCGGALFAKLTFAEAARLEAASLCQNAKGPSANAGA